MRAISWVIAIMVIVAAVGGDLYDYAAIPSKITGLEAAEKTLNFVEMMRLDSVNFAEVY